MRLSKFTWFLTALIAIIYTATLIVIRIENPYHIQAESYRRWRETYIVKQSANRAFVNTSNNRAKPVAFSEGQGYGLYITAAAGQHGWAKSRDFDQLLNYYLAHRDYVGNHHQTPTYLMQWRQYQKNGHWASDINSATDGDLFIAMALHQAARVWPKRAGYYRNLERHLTNDILAYEYNPHTRSLTVGDWATSKSKYYRLMRTSDMAPTFFDTFYQSSHDQRWRIVKDGMLDHLADLSVQHRTGLVPDFAWVTADSAKPVKPWTVTSKVLLGLAPILEREQPDLVLVHGDTTTTMAASLSAFYHHIPICHVEAGLRTWNLASPFPEEANRQITDDLTSLYFAPTNLSRQNLLQEHPPLILQYFRLRNGGNRQLE